MLYPLEEPIEHCTKGSTYFSRVGLHFGDLAMYFVDDAMSIDGAF